VFEVPAAHPTGLAVTPAGCEHDVRFTEAWNALRDHRQWLQQYNTLKLDADADGYEARKSAFFDDPPWASA
jgi:hypothetical protein